MSSSDSNLVMGPYRLECTDDLVLSSFGSGVYVKAEGLDGNIGLQAQDNITLGTFGATMMMTTLESAGGQVAINCNEPGSIVLNVGIPGIGPRIILGDGSITLAVGPAATGPSLCLTEAGILLKVGTVAYSMTLEGITEQALPVMRLLTPVGQTVEAETTTQAVTAAGIVEQSLLHAITTECFALESSMVSTIAEGILFQEAELVMTNG